MALRVLHLSTYDANGGAGRAAYALHRAMVAAGPGAGVESRMLVGRKQTADPTIAPVDPRRFLLASELDRRLWRLQRSPIRTWRSPARFGSLRARDINTMAVDVVNLHWVTDGLLSVEEIGRITKPVVWTLHDMWAFCGTEHYAPDDGRWRTGYLPGTRPVGERGVDIDRWTFGRKQHAWTRPRHLVPVSRWLGGLAQQSALASNWPVTVVPNVMDTDTFAPADRGAARTALGLPPDQALVSFVASAGIDDARKGWDLLAAAMPSVLTRGSNDHRGGVGVVVVGPVTDEQRRRAFGFPVHWLGEVRSDVDMARVLAAVDVAAVPSRADNLPMTATEAHAAGVPVVGFATGGLPDIVGHQQSGYLATPFDTEDLATGLIESIEDARGQRRWAAAARVHALGSYSAQAVIPQYVEIYQQALR